MRTDVLVLVATLCGIPLVACSSSSSGTAGGPADAAGDGDPDNCVAPGTASNAAGIGGYCSPKGNQCPHVGPGGGSTFCTADFGSLVPAHAWFCTALCKPDAGASACGAGGPPCVSVEGESVCVPSACMAFVNALQDGGTHD